MAAEGIRRPQRMIGIRVAITRCIDDSQWPSFIECEFKDVHGYVHRFEEKSAVVTCDDINSATPFPCSAVVACKIVGPGKTVGGKSTYVVDTELPWHVRSTENNSRFEVLLDDLVEWEFGSSDFREFASKFETF